MHYGVVDRNGWFGTPFMRRRSTWANCADARSTDPMKRMAIPTTQSPAITCYRRSRELRLLRGMLLDLDRPVYRMDIFYKYVSAAANSTLVRCNSLKKGRNVHFCKKAPTLAHITFDRYLSNPDIGRTFWVGLTPSN